MQRMRERYKKHSWNLDVIPAKDSEEYDELVRKIFATLEAERQKRNLFLFYPTINDREMYIKKVDSCRG